MIKILSSNSILKELCTLSNRPGILLSYGWVKDFSEVEKAAPILKDKIQEIVDEECIILCDTMEECEHIFDSIVGDDGPTKSNPYNGPAKVYALTCSSNGQLLNENT